jgi:hypothetical protein
MISLRLSLSLATVGASALLPLVIARAKPVAPALVCKSYPAIPDCSARVPSCALCHESTDPPSWNTFGLEIQAKLAPGRPFADALAGALAAIASSDADGDGASNLEELQQGRSPSQADQGSSAPNGTEPNPGFELGTWDAKFAYRRVSAQVSSLHTRMTQSYATQHRGRSSELGIRR